jgi:hypothetical protein
VYERKQNGEIFFSSLAVTCSRFGNCPANGLVTEQPQYSVAVCIFPTWQNTEISLIPNGLRLIFTSSLPLALAILFHCARHSFITNIMANGANIKTAASLAGHSTTRHTEKYVHIIDELKQKAVDSLPDIIVNYK